MQVICLAITSLQIYTICFHSNPKLCCWTLAATQWSAVHLLNMLIIIACCRVHIFPVVHSHTSPDQFAAQMHPRLLAPSLSIRNNFSANTFDIISGSDKLDYPTPHPYHGTLGSFTIMIAVKSVLTLLSKIIHLRKVITFLYPTAIQIYFQLNTVVDLWAQKNMNWPGITVNT